MQPRAYLLADPCREKYLLERVRETHTVQGWSIQIGLMLRDFSYWLHLARIYEFTQPMAHLFDHL